MKYLTLWCLTLCLLCMPKHSKACESDSTTVQHCKNHKEGECVLSGSEKVNQKFTPPARLRLRSEATSREESIFKVYMSDFPSEEAEEAFLYAISLWNDHLSCASPISVYAFFSKWLPEQALAGCSPSGYMKNFNGNTMTNTLYPYALHTKLVYEESDRPYYTITDLFDMSIAINGTRENWYFGTDGQTPEGSYDFVTVVLHELAHGLGFEGTSNGSAFLDNDGNRACAVFDRFVVTATGEKLDNKTAFPNNSNELKNALKNPLYFDAPLTKQNNDGEKVKLYTPSTYALGSSLYHLDTVYNDDDDNALLTHQLDLGRAIHNPGPLLLGMLKDMGWDVADIVHETKDLDEAASTQHQLLFEVKSEYGINPEDVKVHYRKKGGIYSTAQATTGNNNSYTAEMTSLEYGHFYEYYIEAKDNRLGIPRSFTYPANHTKPKSFFFGLDETPPTVSEVSDDIIIWSPFDESFEVEAKVEDNAEIGSVVIEWSIDKVTQTPIEMTATNEKNTYKGEVKLPPSFTGDSEITYRVKAQDKAATPNEGYFVDEETEDTVVFAVKAVSFKTLENNTDKFSTNFEEDDASSFFLQGMLINQPDSSFPMSLNTRHPYELSSQYEATLCYEITVTEEATLSFDEIVLVEMGQQGYRYPSYLFFDYALVEVSKDYGKSWKPLVPGYDANEYKEWQEAWNRNIETGESVPPNSLFFATPDLYKKRTIKLKESDALDVGDKAIIRFRMASDYIIFGWGWSIANLSISLDGSLSLEEQTYKSPKIYPNPATHDLTLQGEGIFLAEFYNLSGQLVKSQTIKANTPTSITDLEPGIYLIKAQQDKQEFVVKFVKQ